VRSFPAADQGGDGVGDVRRARRERHVTADDDDRGGADELALGRVLAEPRPRSEPSPIPRQQRPLRLSDREPFDEGGVEVPTDDRAQPEGDDGRDQPVADDFGHHGDVELAGRQSQAGDGADGRHRRRRGDPDDVREEQGEADEKEDDDAHLEREHVARNDAPTHRPDHLSTDGDPAEQREPAHQGCSAHFRDDAATDRRTEGDAGRGAADVETDEYRDDETCSEEYRDHERYHDPPLP